MSPADCVSNASAMMIVGFEGTSVPDQLRRFVKAGPPAGVVLFARNLTDTDQIAELTRELRSLWPEDATPLIAVDQEGGPVRRLRDPCCPEMLALPAAARLGEHGDAELTREAGRITAAQLAALGFNLNFAPVLDVHSNPANPIIGDRAFGSDPHTVIQHARAWSLGSLAGGVLPCGKHFPGHGDTDLDSHLALPSILCDRDQLEARELPPFREAVRWDIPALMTAHVVFRELDPQWPATLSPEVIPELLRDRLGYTGVVISDDLEMAAIAERHTPDEIAQRGLSAGLDIFLVCRDLAFATRIRDAIAQSPEHRAIQDALGRVAHFRSLAEDNAGRPWSGSLPCVEEGLQLLAKLTP
ncbi:MAG: beta-N-acetylhexosaminidase [Myxococcota bacterium]|nr:beta-N-acetylhexosaminidase [Myxococcota bacterium]